MDKVKLGAILAELAEHKPMTFEELCKYALDNWGLDAQLDCMVEECGEFIAARNHWRRGRTGFQPLFEEIADVAVFCDEMEYYFPEIKAIKEQKIQRLIDKIQANQGEQ